MAKPESKEAPRLDHLIERFAGLPVKTSVAGGGVRGVPVCQMKIPQSCCAGKGYVLGVDGPVVKAAVCKCVAGCQICQGQARTVIDGKSQLCVTPSPRIVAGILSGAQLPARYVNANFQGFTNLSGNGRQVVARMQKWAAQFTPAAGNGILLGGSVGVGKTYLLVALAKALAARGFSVQFADFFQLLSELKAGYSDGKADPAMMAPLMACDVLIIDELGKGRNTEWERTIVDTLIQGRYNQRRPVVASTNYALSAEVAPANFNIDLERTTSSRSEFSPEVFGSLESRVGSRVFSRLRETMDFVDLTGDDFRRRGALA